MKNNLYEIKSLRTLENWSSGSKWTINNNLLVANNNNNEMIGMK